MDESPEKFLWKNALKVKFDDENENEIFDEILLSYLKTYSFAPIHHHYDSYKFQTDFLNASE